MEASRNPFTATTSTELVDQFAKEFFGLRPLTKPTKQEQETNNEQR